MLDVLGAGRLSTIGARISYGWPTKWMKQAWNGAELEPLGLHEARHTFASTCIEAGLHAKAICTYMGHASITITFDRYGHLMPGNEAEALGRLNAYHGAERSQDNPTA